MATETKQRRPRTTRTRDSEPQRRPDRGDPGRRDRGRVPRQAARDQLRDQHRARGLRGRREISGGTRAASSARSSSTSATTACARSPWTRPTAWRAAWRSSTPAARSPCRSARSTLGRIFNLLGETIDEGDQLDEDVERWPIHRDAPDGRAPHADDRDVRDRHQGHRPARALRQGRQGRPVRRRRRRQDRDHPGADPQPRPGARRPVGLLRRGRALPRGQRPLARDDRVGRHRQDDARVRPDERAARRAHARRARRA